MGNRKGVKEGLLRLSKKYPLFIVSNCQSGYIERFLEWSGFQNIFKDFECWGNTKQNKSENMKQIIFRNMLKNPVFIGDTEGDCTAAKNCNVPFIHIEYGFGKCGDYDWSVKTFDKLVHLFL